MDPTWQENNTSTAPWSGLVAGTDRRTFLRWSGVAAGALALTGCEDVFGEDDDDDDADAVTLDFGTAVGVLNYAYALEQLEAAFYTRVVESPFGQINDEERRVLTDLRDHEIAHREFLAAVIRAQDGMPLPALTPNFDSVNFGNRQSVLQTAQTFEDLGVWAYNGAARFIENATFLNAAGEIVSVEARHAAAIRDLLDPLSFAPDAFDKALVPSEVLPMVQPFIRNRIDPRGLPAGA